MEPPTDVAGLRAQVADLQAELDSLRARYDTLLEAKNRAAEHYKADYKKWRKFKRWLFPDVETDEQIMSLLRRGKLVAHARASTLGKRKQLEELAPNLRQQDGLGTRESTLDVKVEHPHSPVGVAFGNQRRRSYHGEPSHKVLSPLPSDNKGPLLVSQPTSHDDTSPVLDVEVPSKTESSRSTPLTEPRKGRGRYAQVPMTTGTINSRFSIRKDRNDGVDFQYDAVVRNRNERKHMLGDDCECCREYYEAVGPLPASRQPLWRTPTKHKAPYYLHASDNDKENSDGIDERKQLISRHRHHWHRPKTPPGYWDIGFPDTQEVLDINRRATEMHRRKLIEVEAEAMNINGRYAERAPRTP